MCYSPRTGCSWRTTPIYTWVQQAEIEWARHGSLLLLSATVWSFVHLPIAFFDRNTRNILTFLSNGQCMKVTRDEHVLGFGFKSCDISIYWWNWMLSLLLKQISIGIDEFRPNFFWTFDSVLVLQVTVNLGSLLGLQVNSGLQPPTRWEPFVAWTILRRPEPTKQRIEPTILSIIQMRLHIWPGSLVYCCYEFHVMCGVITTPHGLRLITVTEIWIQQYLVFVFALYFA